MDTYPDLRVLRSFLTVAHEGNVSRAADILHLTQPAVSVHLKRLAEDTGLTLFRRTPKGLRLTQDGEALLVKAEQVFSALSDLSQTARRMTGTIRGKLRIGTILDPDFTRLGQFLAALVEDYPELETELVHGMSGEVCDRLLRDEIDVGFFLGDPGQHIRLDKPDSTLDEPRFRRMDLTRFVYRVIAPAGWERRVVGKDWSGLASLPWIGTPAASAHNRLLRSVFADRGIEQNIVALVDQEPSMLAMVRSGVGISLCRDSIALHEKQSHGLVVADQAAIETSLCFLALETRGSDPRVECAFEILDGIWHAHAGDAARADGP
ncbi:LysR family transcriptional regulator [Oricola sp.]|uniref:LysR family transcriptional regulator n=1 Tax=Oricola sp. TaxID=1979950 RepID=UPI0025F10CAC|nr:LysR family transcriptional regulator [Oricola sp.]MCI5074772.1 LysR family transcriptional regulator [Oricola sp.]